MLESDLNEIYDESLTKIEKEVRALMWHKDDPETSKSQLPSRARGSNGDKRSDAEELILSMPMSSQDVLFFFDKLRTE